VRLLRLVEVLRAKDRIAATCAIDDLTFTFSIWYEDVDFDELAQRYPELMERLTFHIAMFQINAVASLAPDAISLGEYARFATPAFVELWRTVFKNVWAQWRWEHQRPDYLPYFTDAAGVSAAPTKIAPGPVELLAFCGGGKDSLVALKLLERAGLPFATLGYSHSIYGAAAPQHALLDRVADRTARVRAERQWIIDDFLDAPVTRLRPQLGVHSITAAETPASVFAALPIALARGYKHLVLAHEASANTGNLTWGATGEQVNHQWGKSFEAERMLDTYVQEQLVDVGYWSVLQPIHDEVIFELLSRDAELAPLTHSCNIAKPWCGTCAKCAYVWLQMSAHLPPAIVAETFAGRNLGELAANDTWFRELLGLAEHSPFECVGSPQEARLALGLMPKLEPRLAALAKEVGKIDVKQLAAPLLGVERHAMPAHVAARVMPILEDAARTARTRIDRA
jgi:UDP-N-acetyl-alpha-D-muramoyl-L-alanyl-L-glutamate epimerase